MESVRQLRDYGRKDSERSTGRIYMRLYSRMIYFIDIGDFYRCIDYAKRCETLGRNYAKAI
jgi:hypothetical protein